MVAKNQQRLIGANILLQERGVGLRFDWQTDEPPRSTDTPQGTEGNTASGTTHPSFVIRYEGKLYAYLNRCSHRHIELDFLPGQFFDTSGEYLICSTHAALFDPRTGACCGGPCDGKGLEALKAHNDGDDIIIST